LGTERWGECSDVKTEIIRGWTNLHNEEIIIYTVHIIFKEDEIDRAYSTNGEKRNAYRILVGKPEGKNHWEDQDVGGWIILKGI
jgi:hypothetical protein